MAACDCQHVREAVVLMDLAPRRPADNGPMTFTVKPTVRRCATIRRWQLIHASGLRSGRQSRRGCCEAVLAGQNFSCCPSGRHPGPARRRRPVFLFLSDFTGCGLFIWQLCEHVVEQSTEPLKPVMMWKSQLCSSSAWWRSCPLY